MGNRMKNNKQSKWKVLAATALAVLALGLAGCGGSGDKADKGGKQYKVGIVQLVEHSALDAANKGFVDGLAKRASRKERT